MTSKTKQIEADAKRPDSFIVFGEKVFKTIEKHRLSIALGLIGLFVVGIGLAAYDQIVNWREAKAASRIYNSESVILKKVAELERKESEKLQKLTEAMMASKSKTPPALPEKEKVDFDAVFGSAVGSLEQAILSDLQSQAGRAAAANLIGLYLNYEKVDKATEFVSKLNIKSQDTMGALLNIQVATLAMNQGDYQKASEILEKLTQQKDTEFLRPTGLLKLGLCYEKLQQMDRAKEVYTRVSTEFPDTETSRNAKSYLRSLELQPKPKVQ